MSVRGNQNSSALAWTRADSCAIGALLLAACVTRFWDLASPAVMFFDEDINVPWARCYLYGQPFANSHHPPLPILLIALSILIFGDRSWSWRAPSATLGASLVGVTYLLARRMFHSRLAGALASGLVLCSGLFLVNSRIALHEIFYLTFGAVSFWLLFEYADTERPKLRRRRLGWLGVTLGLGLASKLLIPALMELLVLSFLVFEIAQHHRSGIHDEGPALSSRREIVGALALVGGLSGLVYMAAYLPNYILGWWTGIGDQLAYYREMVNLDLNLSPTGHSYASRWWSWPLLLRPVLYYFHQGDVFIDANPSRAVIKALENPVIGWAVLAAIVIFMMQAVREPSVSRLFIVTGYVVLLAMWVPIRRFTFLYHYSPALYLGLLALGALLAQCWQGETTTLEEGLLLATLIPSLVLGLGELGWVATAAIAITWLILCRWRRMVAARFVCVTLGMSVVVAFVFFWPLWMATPLAPGTMQARMWLRGPGIANWN